jgi:hypothetical protein
MEKTSRLPVTKALANEVAADGLRRIVAPDSGMVRGLTAYLSASVCSS